IALLGFTDTALQRGVGEAQQSDRGGEVHAVLTGAGHQLIQHRHRAPRGTSPGPHHQRQHALADVDGLGGAALLQIGGEDPRGARTRRHGWGWGRERMVPMTLSGSVVATANFTCAGGSSTSLSSALPPAEVTIWASSMMNTL